MNEYGLVFSGGGSRGAYQIGVWKALEQLGLTKYITAVSGTSVGALNGAMFSCISSEKAEAIWLGLSQQTIADPEIAKERVSDAIQDILTPDADADAEGNTAIEQVKALGKRIGGTVKKGFRRGLYSREGLIELIENNGIHTALSQSRKPCFACLFNTTTNRAEYYDMSALSPEKITQLLIATSAVPLFFPVEEIDGERYMDGGVADNIPIKPLYDIGYRQFIVSALSGMRFDKTRYPDAEFIEIYPSDEAFPKNGINGVFLGGLLEFNSEQVAERILLGEKETFNQIMLYLRTKGLPI